MDLMVMIDFGFPSFPANTADDNARIGQRLAAKITAAILSFPYGDQLGERQAVMILEALAPAAEIRFEPLPVTFVVVGNRITKKIAPVCGTGRRFWWRAEFKQFLLVVCMIRGSWIARLPGLPG